MVETGRLTATDGSTLDVQIDSICVHGDTPGAVAMATALRDGLQGAGFAIRPAIGG